MDLKKAFDTVNHKILLKHIYNIGIRGNMHSWLKNYIHNRYQFVSIKNLKSSLKPITCGVPQGSVLGPLLFLIYINSFSKINLKGKINLFADDTTIIYFSNDFSQILKDINDDLKLIYEWLCFNKLTLNFNKSSFMFVSKKKILL